MKHRLMDLLACPIDKSWPVKLKIEKETCEEKENLIPKANESTGVVCRYYCNFKNFFLVINDENEEEKAKEKKVIADTVTIEDCKKCFQIEIIEGTITCVKNPDEHYFEIKESIPVMLTTKQKEEIFGKRRK